MPEQRTYRRFNLIAGGFASAGAIATLLRLFGPHHSYLFLGLVFLDSWYRWDSRPSSLAVSWPTSSTSTPTAGTTVAQNSGGSGYVDNPYTYAGGIGSHTTQLIKFGARWYDPTTGTWTQQDTLNAPLDPHNGNRYIYAADNPINSADPTGRGILGDVLAVAGAVATIAGIAAALTPPGLVLDALVATSIVVGEPAVGGLVCAFDSSASC